MSGLAILECTKTWIHTATAAWSSSSLSSWNLDPFFNRYVKGKSCFAFSTEAGESRRSEPEDIWVATVAKLCYICLDPMSAHHHNCVSRGACGWEPLLTHSGSVPPRQKCQSIGGLPMRQSLASDNWLLCLWSLQCAYMDRKENLSSQTGLSVIYPDILWMIKGGGSLEQRKTTSFARTVPSWTKRVCFIDYMLLKMYWEPG